MEPISSIVEKHSLKKQLTAVGAILVGVAAAVAGGVFDFTLRLGSLALPGWSMYVVAVVAIGLGVAVLLSKEDHCAACNVPLEQGTAHFPTELEAAVVQALGSGALSGLESAPVAQKSMPSVALELAWCGNCQAVGRVSCEREGGDPSPKLVDARELNGPLVAALAAIVEKHKAARGEADD